MSDAHTRPSHSAYDKCLVEYVISKRGGGKGHGNFIRHVRRLVPTTISTNALRSSRQPCDGHRLPFFSGVFLPVALLGATHRHPFAPYLPPRSRRPTPNTKQNDRACRGKELIYKAGHSGAAGCQAAKAPHEVSDYEPPWTLARYL